MEVLNKMMIPEQPTEGRDPFGKPKGLTSHNITYIKGLLNRASLDTLRALRVFIDNLIKSKGGLKK